MQALDIADFLSAEPGTPKVEKYYSLLRGEDLMQVHRHGVNLVLGRDLRRNISYSAVMALELAAKGDRVFYLNTYAGEGLLRDAFSVGGEPPPDPLPSTPEPPPNPLPSTGSGQALKKEGESLLDVGQDARPTRDIKIASVATGQWNGRRLLTLVADRDVLILNSFEFASLTRAIKNRIVVDLLHLQEKTNITLVIFSHSLQRELAARCAGRGPIGVLAAAAASVNRVGEEWAELAKRSAQRGAATPGEMAERMVAGMSNGPESRGKERVNEKRTLNAYMLPRKFGGERPNPTVDIPNDRGFSYHYSDFWCNPFDRGPYADYTGRAMSLLARTPLLQQYLLEHPDQVFMQGTTPTEAKLMAEMTLA